jgi:hypothetical protein
MKLTMLTMLAVLPMAAQLQNERAGVFRQTIEGSWEISATQTSPPPALTLKGLFSFLPGGVLLTTDQTAFAGLAAQPLEMGLLQSPGHGQWARVGLRQFLFTFVKLNFNGRGAPIGTTRFRGILTLGDKPDEATAEFKFDLHLPDGRILVSGTGTGEGKRLEIDVP